MIIVDTALKKREAEDRPIQVGLIGAGAQARAITRTINNSTPGMRVAAIANRNIENAEKVYAELDLTSVRCSSTEALNAAIISRTCAVTNDPIALAQSEEIDAIIEATGSLEYAARAVLVAIDGGKHVILVNAELDATIGPILKKKADAAGVIFTSADGDQPGTTMNLVRFLEGVGVKPVLCGNIKGFHSPYRTPLTQAGFAEKWGLQPAMVSSFADGTKLAIEQAVIANGTGMKVAKRGMIGPDFSNGDPTARLVPLDETMVAFTEHLDNHLANGGPGLVDYVIGAQPGPGVFVIGKMEDPAQRHFLSYYKMGPGPYYCFHTPYHLCHFEVPGSVARAVLFADATLCPKGGATVGVIALAKKDLEPGELVDKLGGFEVYGVLENIEAIRREDLIPIGLAIGARIKRKLAKDTPLTFDDLEIPEGRLIDALYAEQERIFAPGPGGMK